ncbi:MAG TPA: hypothetical protein VGK73_37795, partial [Polyangiaceae bacterium]
SGFGAVLMPVGNAYGAATPVDFEATILAANAAGTGLVFTAWAGYRVAQSAATTFSWSDFSTIMVMGYSGSASAPSTYTLTVAGHPIWSGLQTSFTPLMLVTSTGATINGGTVIATCAGCGGGGNSGAAVTVKDPTGGQGRIVDFAHTAAYGSASWVSDGNLVQLFTNAARWAARCL